MDDVQVIHHIDELVEREHSLRQRHAAGDGLSPEEHTELEKLEVELDQCWDLLRRRRALRNVGEDPDQAPVLDPEVVEHYQQ
jgi:hypothetical protein